MIWNAGDEFDCYDCGAGLRRNVTHETLHFYDTLTKKHTTELVCLECYAKAEDGPQTDEWLEAENQPPDPRIALTEAKRMKS